MKTNDEHFINRSSRAERGNALIYVLIAIALFAALSFTLSRQTDTDEAGNLTNERAKFYATQMIAYAGQARSVVDQMTLTGTDLNNLDFTLPTDATFNTAPHIDKVYHPEGGGLTRATLNRGAVTEVTDDPPPGWYLGRFNNVEWTDTAANDVILVAYQVSRAVCEQINYSITGTIAIPTMNDSIYETMIDSSFFSGGNTDLTTASAGDVCFACNNVASLCVENQAQTTYGFYTVLGEQ